MDNNTSKQTTQGRHQHHNSRGIPPPQSNNVEMKNHLDTGIDYIRSKYPNSGFLLVGDFNQYPDRYLTHCHHFKQTVKSSTRENNILDKCFTNIEAFYDRPKVISQLGKSDHNAVLCAPSKHPKYEKGQKKTKTVRTSGKNEKALFVQAL